MIYYNVERETRAHQLRAGPGQPRGRQRRRIRGSSLAPKLQRIAGATVSPEGPRAGPGGRRGDSGSGHRAGPERSVRPGGRAIRRPHRGRSRNRRSSRHPRRHHAAARARSRPPPGGAARRRQFFALAHRPDGPQRRSGNPLQGRRRRDPGGGPSRPALGRRDLVPRTALPAVAPKGRCCRSTEVATVARSRYSRRILHRDGRRLVTVEADAVREARRRRPR